MNLYLRHFGLREAPFKITPTTEFFYGGGRRGEILHALQYAIEVGEGIMMVTGEVGSGKTMLLRTLEEKLPEQVELVYIANPSLSGREILYNICEELELEVDTNRPDTVRRLQNHLIERHAEGKRVVVFIDEAQAMPDESLEEIRLLSNLETSRHKLLQIALFGQPELLDKLSHQNMRQLRERITVALTLKPFNRDDVRDYITTRLNAAGYNGGTLFTKDGCQLVAAVSQGLSRRINVLCDKAMLSAFERSSEKVQYIDVKRAVKDAKFGRMRYRSEQARRLSLQLTIGTSLAACVVLAVAIGSYLRVEPLEQNNAVSLTSAVTTTLTITAAAQAVEKQEVITAPVRIITAVVSVTVASTPSEDLMSVIAAMQGNKEVNTDNLAAEIAAAAENHNAPAVSTEKKAGWESADLRGAGLEDNEKWGWMPANSYLRLRLNATQTWLSDNVDFRFYTARLITVDQKRSVFLERFLRHFSDFYPLRNVMVYPVQLSSGNRFVITYGVYPSQQDAEVFVNNLPRYFVGGRPFAQKTAVSWEESKSLW
ncbi:AAA family ATPase [Candidatus Persebacteraceae bacterium Df01]|jgi:type II secretory pathway predicted ATPase ExeA|uniref:AAA family ATPase n=1 Tax=Candidatus Doriopsillibacter californiensis TaxID=2970740 RepID=A0ABT7QLA8_9GAMM|nr:AAA family ATPase [Candidatus Persebacteraceae bacterium Df01]